MKFISLNGKLENELLKYGQDHLIILGRN